MSELSLRQQLEELSLRQQLEALGIKFSDRLISEKTKFETLAIELWGEEKAFELFSRIASYNDRIRGNRKSDELLSTLKTLQGAWEYLQKLDYGSMMPTVASIYMAYLELCFQLQSVDESSELWQFILLKLPKIRDAICSIKSAFESNELLYAYCGEGWLLRK